MKDDRAYSFLRMIRNAQRGRLKIYLGYAAGVGKTYQMLQEGHRLKDEGIDVVIGLLETHGRDEIVRLAQGLETVPRKRRDFRGVTIEEMDVDDVLNRKPQVALIDELAHTNVPGSRNDKRYQDVLDILEAGIHVISTLNVQHLESLYDVVEKAVGVKIRERLPDSVLAEADEIVDVDLAPIDLWKRLEEGKIYPSDRVQAALSNFFVPANLAKLRELTLRELASQIDLRRRDVRIEDREASAEQIMVCLSSRGPNSEKLLRTASRLAGRFNRNWYAVYVQSSTEKATFIDARTQRLLSETLTLAKQLGALVFTYKGDDVVETLLGFAREYRVGQIIVGRSEPRTWWKRIGRRRDIVSRLVRKARGITITIIDTTAPKPPAPKSAEDVERRAPSDSRGEPSSSPAAGAPTFARTLSPRRIVIWDRPVEKEEVLRSLAATAAAEAKPAGPESLFEAIRRRENQGSTFFNEGAAFPHVRIPDWPRSIIALGLTRRGISDVATDKPIELVFLLLSPAETPDEQVRLLGMTGRAAQDRYLLEDLRSVDTAEEAFRSILEWESPEAMLSES